MKDNLNKEQEKEDVGTCGLPSCGQHPKARQMRKTIGYLNKNGKLCEIVNNNEQITVEETEQESID